MDATVGHDSSLGSYSLFRSVGSEPRHLWSQKTNGTNLNNKSDSHLDQMFVFGYSCKLFRDDRRAQEIDSGQHLIGWNGSSDHLIDRFDVRGYLNDLSQFQTRNKTDYELSGEELEIERLCDEERFADLKQDETKDDHDEELKRLHLELADGSGYNQIGFNYDQECPDPSQMSAEPVVPESDSKADESDRFKLPSGLSPPESMALPESQKLHNIIEKTALFVSQHGLQMEIILKTKQSSNKNFDFLSFDSVLHPYYKHILDNIKTGKYVPNQNQNSESSDSDDSDDDHYLHPSLLGSAKSRESTTFKIPHLLRSANSDDSYSQLVKTLKDKFPSVEEPEEEPKPSLEPTFKQISIDSEQSLNQIKDKSFGANISQNIWSSLLPSPPPDIEQIIEKLAQKVALSGEQFELSIKKLGESRFEFVNPGHIYHAYYIRRKLHYLEENRSAQAAQLKLTNKKSKTDTALKLPVSFSISTKESKPSIGSTDETLLAISSSKREDVRNSDPEMVAKRMSDNALKDKLALAVRDKAAKEKQEERKRKAAVFLSLLKNKSKDINKAINSTKNKSNDTEMSKSSVIEDKEPLSPTIAAITSPNASPDRQRSKENDNSLADITSGNKSYECVKSGSLLPFTASDRPLKESSSRRSPQRHHKSRHSSGHKFHKRKSRSRTSSRSPSRSLRKRSKRSKSRSRSRSRSHSRRKR